MQAAGGVAGLLIRAVPRYVAFLRAINVGGHVVKMDQLRTLFSGLGFSEVETFIASGNVIFVSPAKDARALERKIEAHLQKSLGYPVATFVRSLPELADVSNHDPFESDEKPAGKVTIYVIFGSAEVSDVGRKALVALNTATDRFAVKGREIYWRRSADKFEPPFTNSQLERAASGPVTMRNRNTIERLAKKYPCE
jgi:uncharacterized protein (DUF1697 family)